MVCCDGLTALPEAIEAVYADAWVQCCTRHLTGIRSSTSATRTASRSSRSSWPIYQAVTEDDAFEALVVFDDTWGSRYPMIGELWRRHWERFIPFFGSRPRSARSSTRRTRSKPEPSAPQDHQDPRHFPTEDAALKLLWLAVMRAEKKWTYPIRDW